MKTDSENFCIFAVSNMAIVAQLVRVPDCGSVGRRFESDLPPERLKISELRVVFRCFFAYKSGQKRDKTDFCVFRGENAKKMSYTSNRLAVSSAYSAVNYLPATLKTNKSGWLIEYYVENPQTQELTNRRQCF